MKLDFHEAVASARDALMTLITATLAFLLALAIGGAVVWVAWKLGL